MSMIANSDSSVSPNSTLARIDTLLGWLVSLPAAALVAIEIVLLFIGVVARYVFINRSSLRMNYPAYFFCG